MGGCWILWSRCLHQYHIERSALVADKLPDHQRSYGFMTQTLIIGIGTWAASNLPWVVSQLGVSDAAAPYTVPMSVKVAFAVSALFSFSAFCIQFSQLASTT